MTRNDDLARLLRAIDGRVMRPCAVERIAEELFGRDGPRVVSTAIKRGKLVRDLRGMLRPSLGGAPCRA